MLICDLAILLGMRGIHISSSLKKKDLEDMFLTPITNDETNNITIWNEISKHAYIIWLIATQYSEYISIEIKRMFEFKTGHNFPIPLTYISKNPIEKIIAYYYLRGYPIIFPKPSFTEEQKILLVSNTSKRPQLIVTNAGPGTGKTTVANERAHLFKFEGVLLISYTNAAISQNHKRLYQYPKMKGVLGLKDYKKRLNVTTVDSLAGYINGHITEGEDHDSAVTEAINRLKSDSEVFNKFAISGQGLMYNHIVADECQDIDDLRGELLLTLFRILNMRSLVLCGDPRQRIRHRCGKWYSDLWSHKLNEEEQIFNAAHQRPTLTRLQIPDEKEFDRMMNEYADKDEVPLEGNSLLDDIDDMMGGLEISQIPEPPPEVKIDEIPLGISEIPSIPHVYTLLDSNVEITRVGFTSSHRFKNPTLVELANKLSLRRPHIHHELKPHVNTKMVASETPIGFLGLNNGYDDLQLSRIALFIRDVMHIQYKVPYSEIAVITPTLAKDNKISTFAQHLYSVFKSHGIPCYSKVEGSYQPIGIVFSTIHSIKGCEFDYVFALGVSGYPDVFHMIPYSEAESLMYVLHTRARIKIFYISSIDNFKMPRGIEPYHIDRTLKASTPSAHNIKSEKEPSVVSFIVTDICKDFAVQKLLHTNGFHLETDKEENYGRLNTTAPPIPEGVDSRFWGVMCGMMIEVCLTNLYPLCIREFNDRKYQKVAYNQYVTLLQQGEIVKGRHISTGVLIVCDGSINTPNEIEILELQRILKLPIPQLTNQDIFHIGKIYDYIISNSTQSRYVLSNTTSYTLLVLFQDMATEITHKFGTCLGTEIHVSGFKIRGCLDSIHSDYIIEFKTVNRAFEFKDLLQVWLYTLLKRTTMADTRPRIPVLINLQTGDYTVVKSTRNLLQWDYIISAFVQLKIHVDLVTYRMNKLIRCGKYITAPNGDKVNIPYIPPVFPNNTFVVDTEFCGFGRVPEIFDLAVVNLNDPYRSLILPLSISEAGLPFASGWMQCTKERFTTSKTLSEAQNLFFQIIKHNIAIPVTLMYYICKTDISWWPKCIGIDMGKKAREYGLKNGIFAGGSQPPTLSTLYASIATLLETQTHLRIHTALSDSLLLYEMAHLDLLV